MRRPRTFEWELDDDRSDPNETSDGRWLGWEAQEGDASMHTQRERFMRNRQVEDSTINRFESSFGSRGPWTQESSTRAAQDHRGYERRAANDHRKRGS